MQNKTSQTERLLVFIGFLLCGIIFLWIAFAFDGTRDSGDSVMHYLMAHYSLKHPELFLNHWGKPLFTLISAPFSQGSFVGIKIFNVLISLLTAWLIYSCGKKTGFRFAWVIPVFLFSSTGWFLAQFSGLTEPLFAFVLVLGIWFWLNQKNSLAVITISFLPFVRSEGMLILGVWAIFLVIEHRSKLLPLLAAGNLVYGIAGMFHYGSPLWYFTSNPYDVGASNYGYGDWLHFPEKYVFLVGVPLLALTITGLIRKIISFINTNWSSPGENKNERLWLIYGCFFTYFLAHVVFWKFGLFHSLGMERVMVAILPFGAWIAAEGFEGLFLLINKINSKAGTSFSLLLLCYVLIFPFTPNPSSLHLSKSLNLLPDQVAINQMQNWFVNLRDRPKGVLFTIHPYLALKMGFDPFDPNQRRNLVNVAKGAGSPGDLVIWDNWFGVIEAGMKRDWLDQQTDRFELLASFQTCDQKSFVNCEDCCIDEKKSEICVYRIIKKFE